MNLVGTTAFFTALLSAALIVPAGAQAPPVEHGRISFAEESGLIKGSADDEWSFASLNSLVLAGDSIWADDEGVLELEFTGGTFLRLADRSRVDVVSVTPTTHFRAWSGAYYLQRVNGSLGEVEFETPVGKIIVQPDTQLRIDVLEDGPTTVSVRWGYAIIHTGIGSPVTVAAGQRSYIDPGYRPSVPVDFDRGLEDAFDSWNRDRVRQLMMSSNATPIAPTGYAEAPIGIADLNDYGDWVSVDDQTYWKPSAVVEYVPYRSGRWSYVPVQGYVWVGDYPFSYITAHHGYWRYHDHHGWIWGYDPYYAPAHVFSIRYDDLFIWAPLDVHGYPIYGGHVGFSIGDFHFNFGFSTFTYAHNLLGGHHFSHALNNHHVHHGHHNHNVHIWDIHSNNSPYHDAGRPHFPRDRIREYTPQRVLRGPQQNRIQTVSARERVARLEGRLGRPDFAVHDSRNNRSIRTSRTSINRRASVRDVNIRPEAMTRAARRTATVGHRPTGSNHTRPILSNTEVRRARSVGSTRSTRTESSTRSVRSTSNTRSTVPRPNSSRPSVSRTRRTVTSPPAVTRPSPARPSSGRAASTRRSVSQPSINRSTTRSDTGSRPTVFRPSVSRPSVTAPPRSTSRSTSRVSTVHRAPPPARSSAAQSRSHAPPSVSTRSSRSSGVSTVHSSRSPSPSRSAPRIQAPSSGRSSSVHSSPSRSSGSSSRGSARSSSSGRSSRGR